MLFTEFMVGTGCKDNEYNHKVYRDLEVMYMNSDLTKEQIYEYGRKLVKNSKSPEQIDLEMRVQADIEVWKHQIVSLKEEIEMIENFYKTETDVKDKMMWRDRIRSLKQHVKTCRLEIQKLKWVLE